MREIKFRAWYPPKGMFEIDVLALTEGPWSSEGRNGVSIPYQPSIEVMQYTGLKDKNGVEIYEGDIVVPTDISGSGRPQVFNPREVSWNPDMCEFNVSRPTGDREIEVIGNIWENWELLE